MFNFFKYLPLFLSLHDLSKIYKEEVGAERPFYLSARFRGAVVSTLSLILFFTLGIDIDKDILQQIVDNTVNIIPLVSAVYGCVITVLGVIRAKRRMNDGNQ